MVQKAWRVLHFIMHIVKKGNKNMKSLAYTSLVRPIFEYGAACWNPYREWQMSALDQVQNKAAKFAHHSEVQTGNLWHSVGRQNECVRSTKRIPERGPGRR